MYSFVSIVCSVFVLAQTGKSWGKTESKEKKNPNNSILQQSKVVGDEIQFEFVKQAFMASSILINGKDGEMEVCEIRRERDCEFFADA